MTLPLAGLRVLDLTQVFAMPGAGMYLADQGADVIKIEPPTGDTGRSVFTMAPIKNESRAFWVLNRNKRSVVIDLQKPAGRALIHRMARDADVFIHTQRIGTDKKLGIDYETIRGINPRIIYVGFTAYGKQGPLAKLRGYDLLVQGLSGMSGRRRMPNGKPRLSGIWAIDLAASVIVPYAIVLALRHRDATGEGQQIDSSLLHTAVALQMVDLVRVQGHTDPPGSTDALAQATYGSYECADGEYVQVAIASDVEWRNLCRATGQEPLIDDPRYKDNAGRLENSDDLWGIFTDIFKSRTAKAWSEIFVQHDVPGIHVLPPQEVFEHPQALANDVFLDIDQPGIGRTRMSNIPFRFEKIGGHRFTPAPALGQHTDEVLREMGLEAAEIASLRDNGVIK
ncbi:MAG: CoA transferase [Candidatus Lambdaproteobacteria bacterium]|nr:CoA transferase [Candidatus Lambdaproteobacteria bacterium]